ncbi:MAG: adenylate kinase, partial [Cyanobacteria bacterium P01_D01_bin.6]
KRFLQGGWVPPAGWPERSPLLKGTLNSYTTVWLCHIKLTPKYRDYVAKAQLKKPVYHLRSRQEIAQFYQTIAAQTDVNLPKNQP